MPDNPPAGTLVTDRLLPDIDLIRDPVSARAFLSAEAVPVLFPGRELRSVTIETFTHRPARLCISLCALDFADGGPPARVSITFAKDDRGAAPYARLYAGRERPVAVWLPGRNCLIETFPHDYVLTALTRLADAASIRTTLEDAGIGIHGEFTFESEILVYRPHESCVLGLTLRPADRPEPLRLVAKVRQPADAIGRFVAVSAALKGQSLPFRVPRAYPLPAEPSLLLMERLDGEGLVNRLTAVRPEGEKLIDAAAAALVAIHGVRFDGPVSQRRGLPESLEYTRGRVRRLRFASPALADRADAVLDAIEALPDAGNYAPTLVHGDFHAGQFLVDESGTLSIVDFDAAGSGDPAVDVGNFTAQLLRRAALGGLDTAALAERFVASYLTRAGASPALERRVRLAHTIALVRKGVRAHLQDTGERALTEPASVLFEEAEACLRAL